MDQFKGVNNSECENCRQAGSANYTQHKVDTAILVRIIRHEEILEAVVEGDFDSHLKPLLVNVGHYAAPQGRSPLFLDDVGNYLGRS